MVNEMKNGIFRALTLALFFLCALLVSGEGHAQATVEYIHTDALGTPVAVTNATGVVIERSEYEPYGQLVNRPLTDGPGFTGHVQDAATGLTYMQQRYYDPLVGKFLSVDPVTAYERPVENFNRYAYADNNPYSYKDPDGEKVVYAAGLGHNEKTMQQHMISLAMSPTARAELKQLEDSKFTYEINIGNDNRVWYDYENRTVYLNPTVGLRIISSGKVQSPKVNGPHEITHAAEHDRIGTKQFEKALMPIINKDGSKSVSREEQRASKVDREVGKDLNEPARLHYQDAERRESVRCDPGAYFGC